MPVIFNMCDESIVTDAASTPLFTALTSAALSIKNIPVPTATLPVFTCIVGAMLTEFRYCSSLHPIVEHQTSIKTLLHCDTFGIYSAWLLSADNWTVAAVVVADSNMVEEIVLAKNGIEVDNIRSLLGKDTGIEGASATNKEVVSYLVSRVLVMGDPDNN